MSSANRTTYLGPGQSQEPPSDGPSHDEIKVLPNPPRPPAHSAIRLLLPETPKARPATTVLLTPGDGPRWQIVGQKPP